MCSLLIKRWISTNDINVNLICVAPCCIQRGFLQSNRMHGRLWMRHDYFLYHDNHNRDDRLGGVSQMKTYLNFQEVGVTKSGKTKIVSVYSGAFNVGTIKWFSKWRRYCFFPLSDMVFDINCLMEIRNQLLVLNQNH